MSVRVSGIKEEEEWKSQGEALKSEGASGLEGEARGGEFRRGGAGPGGEPQQGQGGFLGKLHVPFLYPMLRTLL